jgi:hypothetical protein
MLPHSKSLIMTQDLELSILFVLGRKRSRQGSSGEWELTEIGMRGEGSIVTAGQMAAQKYRDTPTLAPVLYTPDTLCFVFSISTSIDFSIIIEAIKHHGRPKDW